MAEPRRLRTQLLIVTGVLVLGGVLLFATAPEPEGEPTPESAGQIALEVVAQSVERRAIPRSTRKTGVLEARRRLELIAETDGRVVELGADELDRVEAGQLLVRVDPTLAEVALARAEASLARAESRHELARAEMERWSRLADQDAGSLSRRDDAANADRVARADLQEARANLVEARDQLEKKQVLAPFAGVLRDLPVEVGEVLQPGKVLGELLDVDAARLVIGLSDREIVEVEAGQEVAVEVEALPGRRFPGRILRVGAAAELSTKKFPVEIEIANPDGVLLPGMVASARVSIGGPAETTFVPREATFEQHGLRYVYVLENGDGGLRARRRRIEVRDLPFRPSDFEVLEGLRAGERIATSRIRELQDGAAVRVSDGGPA